MCTSNDDLVLLVQDDEDAIKQSEQGIWDAFSVEDLLHKGIASQLEALQAISVNASKEYGLEKALDKMHADWEGLEFKIMEYKDTGTYIVGGTDDIQVNMSQLACQLQIPACSAIRRWQRSPPHNACSCVPVLSLSLRRPKCCQALAYMLSFELLHCRQFWMTRL